MQVASKLSHLTPSFYKPATWQMNPWKPKVLTRSNSRNHIAVKKTSSYIIMGSPTIFSALLPLLLHATWEISSYLPLHDDGMGMYFQFSSSRSIKTITLSYVTRCATRKIKREAGSKKYSKAAWPRQVLNKQLSSPYSGWRWRCFCCYTWVRERGAIPIKMLIQCTYVSRYK